jgi:hypothetical protein
MNKCKIDKSKKLQLIDLAIVFSNLIWANVVIIQIAGCKKSDDKN